MPDLATAFPPCIRETIRTALELNLLSYHQRHGERLGHCTLYLETIDALKLLHQADPDAAERIAHGALTNVSASGPDQIPVDLAAACLRLSLTMTWEGGTWTDAEADTFVAAALALSH